jgi:hypothetical protein
MILFLLDVILFISLGFYLGLRKNDSEIHFYDCVFLIENYLLLLFIYLLIIWPLLIDFLFLFQNKQYKCIFYMKQKYLRGYLIVS